MQRVSNHLNHLSLKRQMQTEVNSSKWSPKVAILELIDNSIDANARNVNIVAGGNTLSISDDGDGTSVAYCIVEPFNRQDTHKGKGTGQYGIGGAYAIAFMTNLGRAYAKSFHDGVTYSCEIDWSELSEDDTKYPTKFLPDRKGGNKGTQIHMQGVRASKISSAVRQALLKDLGILYRPGFDNGLNIVVNGEAAKPPATPLLESPATIEDFTLKCGMKFKVRMGLLAQGVNESYNRVYYGNRMMDSGPDLISDCKTNSSRIIVDVFLQPDECRKHGLTIATTKESFISNDDDVMELLDEMRSAISERFQDILTKASEQVRTFQLRFMTTAINHALRGALSHRRETTINAGGAGRGGDSDGGNDRPEPDIKTEEAVDQNEIGNERATGGEFSINFRMEPTFGDAGAIAVDLTGSEIVLKVNQDKQMGRTPDQQVEWMLGAIPGLIRTKLYDWGSNRQAKIDQLVAINPDWFYLLEGQDKGGMGTTPLLIELFNNARPEALAALAK